MNEEKILGEIALKLERYRYNIVASLGWIIFGMIIGSATALMNALLLLGYDHWVFLILLIAGLLAGFVYRYFWRFVPGVEEIYRPWKYSWVLFALPFLFSYSVIPPLLDLSGVQNALYYSLAWYPSLGVGLILAGLYVERKSRFIVTKSMTLTGVAIIVTSTVFVPFTGSVSTTYHVVALSLLADGLMMGVYLFSGLYGFVRAQKGIYG